MNTVLKINALDSKIDSVIEEYLQSNYPEAKIKKSRRENAVIMKRTAWERLTIRIKKDEQNNTTILTFNYYKWRIKWLHFGLLGVWPTPMALPASTGFVENLAGMMGNRLQVIYRTKTEYIEPTGIQPDTFFTAGILLLGVFFFLFSQCFDFAHSDSIWWFLGWCKSNWLIALSYTFVSWLLFFFIWKRKRSLPILSYVIFLASCMLGWTSLSLAYNIGRLDGSVFLTILFYTLALLTLFFTGVILHRQSEAILE